MVAGIVIASILTFVIFLIKIGSVFFAAGMFWKVITFFAEHYIFTIVLIVGYLMSHAIGLWKR